MNKVAIFLAILWAGTAREEKRPVPSEEAQIKAEKTIRDVFKDEYSAKSAASQQQFARRLLDQAGESKDDDALRYVMLREAGSLATRAGDVELLLQSLERMSTVYQVPLSYKDSVLGRAEPLTPGPEGLRRLTEARFKLIQEAIDQEQADLALHAAQASVATAKKTKEVTLTVRAEAMVRSATDYRSLLEKAKSAERTLDATPEDPPANLTWGEYLSLTKGQWEKGLAYMAKGPESPFKTLSLKELAAPPEAAELVAIADGWWDLAGKEKSAIRKVNLLAHAKVLYEKALPASSTLVRVKIQKRLAEVESKTAPENGVDLLRLIDPKKDAVEGTWEMQEGSLVSYPGGRGAKLQIPYLPPSEYDLKLVVQPKGSVHICVMLVGGGAQFMLVFQDKNCAIHQLDSETMCYDNGFNSGKPVVVEISVRKSEVTVAADGRKLMGWAADWKRAVLQDYWGIPSPKALGLGGMQSATFSKVFLTPVSGEGKKLR